MLKIKLILLFLVIFTSLNAQTSVEEELEIIETPEEVANYLESKDSKKNKLITFNEEKHKTLLAKDLFKLRTGGTKVTENEYEKTHYKVINKTLNTYYRVSYIYLDATKYSLEEINSLRYKIITEFNNGAPFDFLAKRYSMDANAKKGGDLGWFIKGSMHADFEREIVNGHYNLNDIFTIDIPSNNWYYVVLKSHEPKEISEIEVLKIVEQKK